jgi:phosphoribosylanthranilate isomerase
VPKFNPPQHVTFTGLDERTDLERVKQLSKLYPVEWGILYSPKRAGNEPRYPLPAHANKFVGHGLMLAGHLCGGAARTALHLERANLGPEDMALLSALVGINRVQINYVPNPDAWPHLRTDTGLPLGYWEAERFARTTQHPVIVQHRTLTYPEYTGLHYLFDKSGGKGEGPKNWPKHPDGKRLVGYAGGLGPEVVVEQLARMDTSGPYWLDMEGRVRTADDWLDLDKCEAVLEQVYGKR